MKNMNLTRMLVVSLVLVAVAMVPVIAGVTPLYASPAADYVTGCTGEYFNNTTLAGSPAFVRNDPAINFFWPEYTSPAPNIGVANYSVRWTCSINVPVSGTYTFTMVADDGMNLLVDGNLLIWAWYDQGPSTYSNPIYLGAGVHTVQVQYYNDTLGGTARVYSDITPTNIYHAPTYPYYPTYPNNPPSITGTLTNCRGEYYNNALLSGSPSYVRIDPAVNFYWPAGVSPAPGIGTSYYSVRWTCNVYISSPATYTFNVLTDDGTNLVVDNNVILWAWRDQGPTPYTAQAFLNPGNHLVRVDYYNGALNGTIQVSMH